MSSAALRQYPYDQGLVLAPPQQDRLFLLNEIASQIWDAQRLGLSPEVIAAGIAELYSVPQSEAETDVLKQLDDWRKVGLLGRGPIAERDASESFAPSFSQPAYRSAHTAEESVAQLCYQLGPCCVSVQYASEELLQLVHPILAHLAVPDCPSTVLRTALHAGEYLLLEGDSEKAREGEVSEFAMRLIRAILVSTMEASNAAMLVHGAAVARGDECIVFPGVSGSGKSTLAAALACSGFTLLGDDVLIIDAQTLRLRPVPMSLNLKPGSLPVLRDQYGVDAGKNCLRSSRGDVHYLTPPGFKPGLQNRSFAVKQFVFPTYQPDAACRLSNMDASAVLSGLLESNSTVVPDIADEGMVRLLAWLEMMPGSHMVYGSLPDAVDKIETLFSETNNQI